MPWPDGFTAEPPEMNHHIRAARLLAVASVQAFVTGESSTGVRYLEAVFGMGGWFVDGTPSLLPLMVGFSIQSMGMRVVSDYLDAKTLAAVDSEVRAILPNERTIRDGLRFAIGGEWRNAMWFLDHELETNSGPFAAVQIGVEVPNPEPSAVSWNTARALGLYDAAHTRFLMTDHFASLQRWCGGEKLGVAWAPPAPASWGEMGWVKWIHNPIGRILSGIGMPNFGRYIGRTGKKSDRMRAAWIVLEVRRFYRDQGRWPGGVAEVVPGYIEVWPHSALDGGALRWEEDGIRLLDEKGESLCFERSCLVPFVAPRPVIGGRTEVEPVPLNPHR